ncbi:fucose permease [Sphingobacterium allocomposti]|uniref:Fucose permease n=1 Tax=Sphingobacterium allocomposti TaxID=415956 RepID=A0A5S5D2J8_9SPHI|nr:MFS transporter [Sphingobacterium composti Yoo et al. 2007 non Ten et al. 2007]TYP90267.1 fucose permease [Sphingobacterium composti Yoo et al. 2007 non Ten et al. 2007]HLS95575.1 MFS transporter [Sphingobacterium sp.]
MQTNQLTIMNAPASAPSVPELLNKQRIRLAVSLFYFGQGLAFASWASRIPIIKASLQLTEAQLGTVLLMLPVGQLMTMPISGRLVSKYGSHSVLPVGACFYLVVLCLLSFAENAWHLGGALLLFGIAGNICNISVNTQGVLAENLYRKSIMSSFHGAWSIAGFSGALIGLATLNLQLSTSTHFYMITGLLLFNVFLNKKFLVEDTVGTSEKKSFSFKPDKLLVSLGVIGFCSMATEGAMFDWSGVYFHDIVKAPENLTTLGYAAFMVMMATGRFIGDAVISRIGRQRTLQISGIFMFLGMMSAVVFPNLIWCTLAFMLVGLGVACNVPSVYSVAGTHKTISSGVALAMVSSVSYLGFLMGPPLIGYIAQLLSLRYSFGLFACFGLLMFVLTSRLAVFRTK